MALDINSLTHSVALVAGSPKLAQPPVPAKPRLFKPLASPTSPMLPRPPRKYPSSEQNYSSDSALGSPDMSSVSVAVATDLDNIADYDHDDTLVELNGEYTCCSI